MTKTLQGKVALITGGSRGLGAATARHFADLGADIAISYVSSREKAEAVVAELRAKGVKAVAIQSDQGDPTAAPALIEAVIGAFNKLDIFVSNAAIAVQGKRIDDPSADIAELDRQWRVNVLGVVATTRAASQKLSDGGRIILIGSGLGTRVAFPFVTEYSATKAAVLGFAHGAARDLGPRNITVNVVQPGVMMTDMGHASAGVLPSFPPGLMAIERVGTVEEVAAGIAYLAGPDASYVTGTVLDISGGYQV
ncbi:SDR family NAD(P)-dependent oxidoreductase [Tianweitania sp.]|uniref:SDR family NAD(P)-dependent oxidoreductase n=1 Tax=Tianweitania sp. TaxID=2021634 RepID=UPI0028A12E2A|nr:SDR family oxidoreductase [Tianweitania sp.]